MDISTSMALIRPFQLFNAAGPVIPVALGFLPDLTVEQGSPMTPADLTADFIGTGITYTLAPGSAALPAGLSLSANGVLSGTPTALAGPLSIVIRGTNTEGSADSAFSLTVLDMLLDFSATVSGLTTNPTYGPSAQTGVGLTAAATGFSGSAPSSISYQWATLESGAIAGATSASYTPSAALFDGETLYCRIMPAGYPAKDTPGHVIRHVPPTAAGGLWDEIVDLGSGPELFDVAFDFTGEALVYSVTGPGTFIDKATGLLTILTDSPVAGALVTVTALNSGGLVQSAFSLTVEDAGTGPGPDLGQPILNDASNTIDLTVDVDCTIYWRRDATATNPDAAQVIAGGGFDSGSFAVTSGSNAVPVTFAPGNDGVQEISFVAAEIPSEPSIVQTVAIEIDATDPVLLSTVPANGAGGIGVDVIPTLTFSETVVAGTGTVTLYDVTGAVAHEVFDVVADAGTGAGQIEISGDTVTLRPSSDLTLGRDYAILADPGALRDLAGNPFAGIAGTTEVAFSVGTVTVVDTDFGAGFPTAEPSLWASMQANPYNSTPEHRGAETWSAYPASVTDGGIVGVKSGNYPQLRFSVPVEAGRTYAIDADFPLGEDTWAGPLRVKIGSARDLSDYQQIDEDQAGQPRVVELRGQQVTATSNELWFAVIVETGATGTFGGHPAISMLHIERL